MKKSAWDGVYETGMKTEVYGQVEVLTRCIFFSPYPPPAALPSLFNDAECVDKMMTVMEV